MQSDTLIKIIFSMTLILGAETDSDTTNNLVPTVNAATRRSGKTLNFEGRYQVWLNQLKMQTTPWMVRYSPYFGYEPYWVGGDWLLIHDDKVSTTRLDASGNPIKPISPPDVCGNECEFMFWRYGKICATTLSSIIWYWTGRDEQWYTFDSYCHLQAWNCKQPYKETTYAFSHLGQCENETYLIPMDPWMRWDRDTLYFDTIRSHNATEELLKQLESNLAKYNKTVIFTYPSTLATVRG